MGGGTVMARPGFEPRTFLTLEGSSYQPSFPGQHAWSPLHLFLIGQIARCCNWCIIIL